MNFRWGFKLETYLGFRSCTLIRLGGIKSIFKKKKKEIEQNVS